MLGEGSNVADTYGQLRRDPALLLPALTLLWGGGADVGTKGTAPSLTICPCPYRMLLALDQVSVLDSATSAVCIS